MGVIIDPATINPTIVEENPLVQGKNAGKETRIANEESIKSEQLSEHSNSKETK